MQTIYLHVKCNNYMVNSSGIIIKKLKKINKSEFDIMLFFIPILSKCQKLQELR